METKEVISLLKQQQDEYLKRLEKLYKENNITSRIRTICFSLIIIVWIICYFTTPYLTKNYNKINNESGNVITNQE